MILSMRSRVLAVALAFAGCGDDGVNNLPDGPGQPDTSPDTPTTGLVKLTVRADGLPRMGVKVHFQNSDSSTVSATMTDVNGVASAVMEAGGFVTAIDPFPARALPQGVAAPNDLRTFAGVKPGDELVLTRNEPVDVTQVTVNLLVNPDPNVAIGNYTLFAPCFPAGIDITNGAGSGAGSGAIGGGVVFTGCGNMTDLTVMVDDGLGFVSFFHKPNVALVDATDLDLTDQTYAAVEQATWQYTDAPASLASFNVVDLLATARGAQFSVFESANLDTGTGITVARPRPLIANGLQITSGSLFGTAMSTQQVLEWGPQTAAYSKSLANALLPDYETLPAYDVATKTVSWTAGAGVAPDLAVVNSFFRRDTPILLDWNWEVVAPLGTETQVRYPVLPGPDDAFNPTTGDVIQQVDQLITAKVPGGYDAIRADVLSIQEDPNTGVPLGVVSGAAGTVLFTQMSLGVRARKQTPQQLVNPFAHRARGSGASQRAPVGRR